MTLFDLAIIVLKSNKEMIHILFVLVTLTMTLSNTLHILYVLKYTKVGFFGGVMRNILRIRGRLNRFKGLYIVLYVCCIYIIIIYQSGVLNT